MPEWSIMYIAELGGSQVPENRAHGEPMLRDLIPWATPFARLWSCLFRPFADARPQRRSLPPCRCCCKIFMSIYISSRFKFKRPLNNRLHFSNTIFYQGLHCSYPYLNHYTIHLTICIKLPGDHLLICVSKNNSFVFSIDLFKFFNSKNLLFNFPYIFPLLGFKISLKRCSF